MRKMVDRLQFCHWLASVTFDPPLVHHHHLAGQLNRSYNVNTRRMVFVAVAVDSTCVFVCLTVKKMVSMWCFSLTQLRISPETDSSPIFRLYLELDSTYSLLLWTNFFRQGYVNNHRDSCQKKQNRNTNAIFCMKIEIKQNYLFGKKIIVICFYFLKKMLYRTIIICFR